jgi:hypothetical protein
VPELASERRRVLQENIYEDKETGQKLVVNVASFDHKVDSIVVDGKTG